MRRTLNVLLLILMSWPGAAQLVSVDEAIELALEKNFDVRVQRANALSAQNDYRFVNGAFLPQLNATGAYLKSSNDSRAVTFANVETIRKGVRSTNLAAQGQLTWTLFDGTRMFAT